MIQLSRHPKPTFLTPQKVKELTDEFKANETNVWNVPAIKKPLLESSFNKCAYCECLLTEESKYMEVEHFEDKKNNSDKVIEWENLLPSCKKCNGAKSTHDVLSEPIVNPYTTNPNQHLGLRYCFLKGLTSEGKNSIIVNNLNDPERMVAVRQNIGTSLNSTIEKAEERFETYLQKKNTIWKNKTINTIKGLLNEALPTSEYAATTSTLLLTDPSFITLCQGLKDEGLWADELQEKFTTAESIKLAYL